MPGNAATSSEDKASILHIAKNSAGFKILNEIDQLSRKYSYLRI